MNKSVLFPLVDRHRDEILSAQRYIWKNPETGYREYKTAAYMEKLFENLGYRLTRAETVPGFFTEIDTGRPGPKVLVFGELDSILCPTHPDANPETGAVHACGHKKTKFPIKQRKPFSRILIPLTKRPMPSPIKRTAVFS